MAGVRRPDERCNLQKVLSGQIFYLAGPTRVDGVLGPYCTRMLWAGQIRSAENECKNTFLNCKDGDFFYLCGFCLDFWNVNCVFGFVLG